MTTPNGGVIAGAIGVERAKATATVAAATAREKTRATATVADATAKEKAKAMAVVGMAMVVMRTPGDCGSYGAPNTPAAAEPSGWRVGPAVRQDAEMVTGIGTVEIAIEAKVLPAAFALPGDQALDGRAVVAGHLAARRQAAALGGDALDLAPQLDLLGQE